MAPPLHESHEKDGDWRNLETLVLLDEFLKEIYSILQVLVLLLENEIKSPARI